MPEQDLIGQFSAKAVKLLKLPPEEVIATEDSADGVTGQPDKKT